MEIYLKKIYFWIQSYDHKEASVQVWYKPRIVYESYSNFKNFNHRVNVMFTGRKTKSIYK